MFQLIKRLINSKRPTTSNFTKSSSRTVTSSTINTNSKLNSQHTLNELKIIGNGIVAAMEAYSAYQNGLEKITVIGSNKKSTARRIAPSLTPDETIAVVPRGSKLTQALNIPFYQPGGIRIDDVPGVNDSIATQEFVRKAQQYGQDELIHQKKNQTLLEVGRFSMLQWEQMYQEADPQLKNVFQKANYRACREPMSGFFDGYRIDLINGISDANKKAINMKNEYQQLGYQQCRILLPEEVLMHNPYLADFCYTNSLLQQTGQNSWLNTATALYRPGGCIDADSFLPAFYDYLKNKMGTYTTSKGDIEDRFQLQIGKEVKAVFFNENKNYMKGLQFSDNTYTASNVDFTNYVFCPGENVGFLKICGLIEPAAVRFAGVSLKLNIPISDKIEQFRHLNNWMEIHKDGVVLAWQARFNPERNDIFIGVAGTKSLYGTQIPLKEHAFARNRYLLQLNIINEVMPELISIALGRNTKGCLLTEDDLHWLEVQGIATLDVGSRSVAYDGFPTVGKTYAERNNVIQEVANGWVNTHWGSGGVSCAPAAAFFSQKARKKSLQEQDSLTMKVLQYGSVLR